MKIVILTSFNSYYGNELIDRCMRRGFTISAIVCIGDHADYTDRRIFWEYTNYAEGLSLVDLEKYSLPMYIFRDLNSTHTLKKLRELQPDLLLQGGVGIIKKDIIELPAIGVINSHPGLLPKYRGCMAVEWSILNNDPVGATCHFVDEGVDSGSIIFQQHMDITREMDYHKIRCKAFTHQANVMIEGIQKIKDGLRLQDAQKQVGGDYFKPMNEQNLIAMKKILAEKKYGHYLKVENV